MMHLGREYGTEPGLKQATLCELHSSLGCTFAMVRVSETVRCLAKDALSRMKIVTFALYNLVASTTPDAGEAVRTLHLGASDDRGRGVAVGHRV